MYGALNANFLKQGAIEARTNQVWKREEATVGAKSHGGLYNTDHYMQADNAVAPQAWSGYEERAEEASDVSSSTCSA